MQMAVADVGVVEKRRKKLTEGEAAGANSHLRGDNDELFGAYCDEHETSLRTISPTANC